MAYDHPLCHGGKNQSEQITDEFLTCIICQIPGYKEPKLLTCGHTFCKPCLEQYLGVTAEGTFPCPTCHSGQQLPPGGVGALADNLFVDTQIDRLLRRQNAERGRDDTWYNISVYDQDYRGHATLNPLNPPCQ